MNVDKGCLTRVKEMCCTIDEPQYKSKRSLSTMIKYTITIIFTQFLLQTLIFPFMPNQSIKTIICLLSLLWFVLLIIVWALGPGVLKPDPSVSLIDLLEEFSASEICPDCKVIKLPRSRHCDTCNSCIDRFDHHCQWINSCIGKRNHNFFLGFVFM